MAALAVAYFGYGSKLAEPGGMLGLKILPKKGSWWTSVISQQSILALYKASLEGISAEQAAYEYLKLAQNFVGYGSGTYIVRNQKGTEILLAITPSGIKFYDSNNKLRHSFDWGKKPENVSKVKVSDNVIKVKLISK